MPSIAKPIATHPSLQRNALGLNHSRLRRRDVHAVRRLRARFHHRRHHRARCGSCRSQPHMIAKLSGIGCSSKTPTYFVSGAHGFNSAHGRMPAIATGANAANRELTYIGISGDGDSLSIGLGQLCHAIRRNVEYAVRHREQRRVRIDQGPVLGFGRRRFQEQARRGESHGAHRSGHARASAWERRSSPAVFPATKNNWFRS